MNDVISKNEPDWSLWRSFGAVVAEGSLSAAARKMCVSQPTLGRHIDTLELQLNVTLFERTLNGFKPTQVALKLYEPVKNAQIALARARNMAEGQSEDLSGSVRITASLVFSHYTLPKLLTSIRENYPEIDLEFAPTDTAENLLMREADIAIRMFRPTQLDLITKHIGNIPLMFCAHKDYLAKNGTPASPLDITEYDLIGFDRSDLIIRSAKEVAPKIGLKNWELKRSDFALRSDSQTLMWELIKAGLGIGVGQVSVIQQTPDMEAFLPEVPIPPLPIWLTTHRELFTNRRIRVIYDALADLLSNHVQDAQAIYAQILKQQAI